MNVLMVGDVVGPGGCQFLQERLYRLKKEYAIDVTIVNGENSAKGNGITERSARDLLSCGADVLTTGNHCFQRREALGIYEQDTILRPANYPEGCPGKGVCVLDLGAVQLAVLNLSGTAYLDPLDNPFTKGEQMLQELDTQYLCGFSCGSNGREKGNGVFPCRQGDGCGGNPYARADSGCLHFIGTHRLYHGRWHDRPGGVHPWRCCTAGAGSLSVSVCRTLSRGGNSVFFECSCPFF